MPKTSPQRIGVIGPAGFGGSYLCVELLNRGHTVVGISRNPSKVGDHARFIPRPVDIDSATIEELAEKFEGVDALVCEFGPHTAGAGALLYMPYLESIRRILLAHKSRPNPPYFIFIGGAGSLHVPGTSLPCVDHPDFFLAYRRAISTSLAHIAYMEERLGIMGTALRQYRIARLAQSAGSATRDDEAVIAAYEQQIQDKDDAADFIKAGRTAYMFFDGRVDFEWSFCSPPALYRPGLRTGRYQVSGEEMVLLGGRREGESVFEGRLTGISVADLAIAIADEVKGKKLVGRHWSAWGDISEDVPAPAYASLSWVDRDCS